MQGIEFDHCVIHVSDWVRSNIFYRDVLGAEIVPRGAGTGLCGGAVPVEGGIPLLMDGKIIGAIGVSGATSAQDGQCAQAGVNALS